MLGRTTYLSHPNNSRSGNFLHDPMRAPLRLARLTLASFLAAAPLASFAANPVMPDPAAETSAVTAMPEDALPQGQATDLQRLIEGGGVRELRATSNGDYATKLLVENDRVVFYVTMYYENALWRVFRKSTLNQAETVYSRLTKQRASWADDDIHRKILASRKREQEEALQNDQARAAALTREVAAMESERARIAEEQKAVTSARQSAEKENRSAAIEIEKLRAQIRQLESQLSSTGGTASHASKVTRASQQQSAK